MIQSLIKDAYIERKADESTWVYYDKTTGELISKYNKDLTVSKESVLALEIDATALPPWFPQTFGGRKYVDELGTVVDHRFPLTEYQVDLDTHLLREVDLVAKYITPGSNLEDHMIAVRVYLNDRLTALSKETDYLALEVNKASILDQVFVPNLEQKNQLSTHFQRVAIHGDYIKALNALSPEDKQGTSDLIQSIYRDRLFW